MAEEQVAATTIEEALANAGTTVLSHLESGAHKLTLEEVDKLEEENPQEVLGYAGPYTDMSDDRNAWTAYQDIQRTDRTKNLVEDAQKAREEKHKEQEKQLREQREGQQPAPRRERPSGNF